MAYDHEKTEYDERGIHGIKGTTDDKDTFNIKGDKDTGSIRAGMYVWNTTYSRWDKWTGTEGGGSYEPVVWNDNRVAYLDGRFFEYFGQHEVSDASEDDVNWAIERLYYDENNMIVRIQRAIGAWSDRENLW
jgi:hypothetical protein